MKLLLLSLVMSVSTFASVADIRCNLNGPIVIDSTWGATRFSQAEIVINNLDVDSRFATMYIQDRFGPNFENFNRLWIDRSRCRSNSVCIRTDFSSLRGLTVTIPKEALERRSYSFNTRIRNNRFNRTHFASCRSTLR